MRTDVPGTIYLLHFETKVSHAQHYIGWTETDLRKRLCKHMGKTGARLVAAVVDRGIKWFVVRKWEGTRKLERKLKKRKGAPALCPVCRGELALSDLYSGPAGVTRLEEEWQSPKEKWAGTTVPGLM